MATWTKSSKQHNKPKQYLQGFVEFYKLKFKVDERVLIPRPETELLVDEILKFYTLYPKPYTLIDVGTGSGNIALSVAKNLPKVKIFATDISDEALDLAKENAKLNQVQDRIFFFKSDLLSVILEGAKRPIESRSYQPLRGFQDDNLIIATNLPYIPSGRIPYLDPSVKDFEPRIALEGGPDGFDLYRKLFKQIVSLGSHLKGVKLIIGEIDYTHGELAIQSAKKYFPKAQVEVKTDLAKNIRILIIQPAALPKRQ